MKNVLISTIDAINIANKFQELLEPLGVHIALGGSCLHRGGSYKDIDLIVLPHNTTVYNLGEVLIKIENIIGNKLVLRDHLQYNDAKIVYKTTYSGLTIDLFFLS